MANILRYFKVWRGFEIERGESMVANKNKFNGKMAENEYTISKLATALDLAEATVRLKIKSDKYEFTLSESVAIKKLWNLTDAEYLEIFIYF
jgi:hypothetical protein